MDMNYAAAAPEIFLGLAICVVLLADVFLRDDQRNITYVLAMLALIGTAAVTALFPVTSTVVTFSGSYVTDPASGVLKMFAYITVGNFHVGAATVFAQVPTNYPLTYYSYYYVDDVSVQAVQAPQLGPDISACGPVTLVVQDPMRCRFFS